MEVLLLDNHDSFTYNIAHIFNELSDVNLQIITADKIKIEQIDQFDAIIFSPGPDIPEKGNIMEQILGTCEQSMPILGICLGLQAIVLHYGGSIQQLDQVVHGRTKIINTTNERSELFEGIGGSFEAGLYHSWVASPEKLPDELLVTAISDESRIMAVRHRQYNIEAVQFHPESIMTPLGSEMIHRWLNSIKKHTQE
jgi:anthranilate synthase component 2